MSHDYLQLNKEREEIRLLEIYPGRWEQPIICDLAVASLLEHPVFDALSYAWEGQKPSVGVRIGHSIFEVTRNLENAIRRLREETSTVRLWADGVCIDQTNRDEKGYQVGLMRRVYCMADTVHVWLGELSQMWRVEAEDFLRAEMPVFSEPGFPGDEYVPLQRTESRMQHDLQSDETSGSVASARYFQDAVDFVQYFDSGADFDEKSVVSAQEDGLMALSTTWKGALAAMFWILSRTWWSRLWVVQEVALPRKDPLLHFGHYKLSFSKFLLTTDVLMKRFQQLVLSGQKLVADNDRFLCAFVDRAVNASRLRSYRTWSLQNRTVALEDMVYLTSRCQTTDPRDYYYAVLGLFPGLGLDRTRPDYNKTTQEVFIEATRGLVVGNGDLRHLYCVRKSLEENRDELPSWCIDWRRDREYRISYEPCTWTYDRSSIDLHAGPAEISVHATLVDEVLDSATGTSVHGYVKAAVALASRHGWPHDHHVFRKALLPKVFDSVNAGEIWNDPEADALIQEWCSLHMQITDRAGEERLAQDSKFRVLHRAVDDYLLYSEGHNAHFFVTSAGVLGHANIQTLAGDQLYALMCCHHAAILRPNGRSHHHDNGSLEFVSFCYLHDFDLHQFMDSPHRWDRIVLS